MKDLLNYLLPSKKKSLKATTKKPGPPKKTLDIDGDVRTYAEWAKVSPVSESTIRTRMSLGRTAKEAVYGAKSQGWGGFGTVNVRKKL